LQLVQQLFVVGANAAAEGDLIHATQAGGHGPDPALQPV
jgi:hypothetical protein